jgi:hypothetical protein
VFRDQVSHLAKISVFNNLFKVSQELFHYCCRATIAGAVAEDADEKQREKRSEKLIPAAWGRKFHDWKCKDTVGSGCTRLPEGL